MPYTREHKARTRARIVEKARVLFNLHGFEAVSIDAIMEAAGLTRGGFYNHFGSKHDLYAEVVLSFADSNPYSRTLDPRRPRPSPQALARGLVTHYLSDEVLDDIEQHCPLYALPSDVARSGRAPREAYTALARRMLRVFEAALPKGRASKQKAELIVTLCVGGMLLSRTTSEPELARSLRASAKKQALAMLEP